LSRYDPPASILANPSESSVVTRYYPDWFFDPFGRPRRRRRRRRPFLGGFFVDETPPRRDRKAEFTSFRTISRITVNKLF